MNPSVSIVTISKYDRFECLKLLLENIKNQTYKNITEWVIVGDGVKHGELIKSFNSNFKIKYIPSQENNNINKMRNLSNYNATGDIIVCMDDDDYYFPTRVEHCVEELLGSNILIAGSSQIYLYDYILNKTFVQKLTIKNNTLAYKKEYLINHSYDESTDDNTSFIDFTNPIIELTMNKTLVQLYHNDNLENIRENLINSFLRMNNEYKIENVEITDIIPQEIYQQYKNIFINSTPVKHDIVYLTGGHGITWDPTDMKLGGSEQAVVNLSENWVNMGKKVAVYGKFNKEQVHNGVEYIDWLKFPYERTFNIVISWRTYGIYLLMHFKINAVKIIQDFHDNFSYTLNELKTLKNRELLEYFNNINQIYFKSNYHKNSFEEFMGYKLMEKQYRIILNGLRVEQFLDNKDYVRNPYRFCYCSCYTRGLELILKKIWPIIYKNEPRAELHIYYGMDYIFNTDYKIMMNLLMSQPGVMDHGRQPMEMIVREKYLSTFHIYLSSSIAEIDCISIRESLITGCIPLITKETVFLERDGVQYVFDPNNNTNLENVALDIVNKMNDFTFVENARTALKKSSTIIGWDKVAELWL